MKKQLSESLDAQGLNQRQTELRRSLNDAEAQLHEGAKQQERPKPSRSIIIGDTVELIKLGTKASVIGINRTELMRFRQVFLN